MGAILKSYTSCLRNKIEDNVAQCYTANNLLNNIEEFLEFVDYLKHVNVITISTPPLLELLRSSLNLKLSLLKIIRTSTLCLNNRDNDRKLQNLISKPYNQTKKNQSIGRNSGEYKPNSSQEKILNYIKNYPNKRTKDIIYEFSSFSDRTVKRNLTELVRAGLINRKTENKAAYYSVTD